MNYLFYLLALLAGTGVAMQSQINGELGKRIGPLEAAFFSFTIGTILLFFLVLFFGKGSIPSIASVPKWQFAGGLFGAFFVAVITLCVPRIGVSLTLLIAITGQIIIGAVINHYGLFGAAATPISIQKLAAIGLMLSAIAIYR
ncbi:DMT family transporter [Pradoshia sp.]